MKAQLLKHTWQQFVRSPTLTQNVIQTVVLGIFALYFILTMLGLAFLLRSIIEETWPGQNYLSVTGGLIGYYFLTDLITRFFLQKYPALAVKPYLALPIKKNGLAHYLLLRSLGSFFNFLPFFFFAPFFLKDILFIYPQFAFNYALFFVGMILFNNFLSFGITKNLAIKGGWSGLIIVGIMGLFFMEYQGYFSLFEYFKNVIGNILRNTYLSAVPLFLSGLLYFLLHRFFRQNLYLENVQSNQQLLGANLSIGWFDRFGDAGKLMDLELKLMLRSKRARAYLIFSIVMLLYPLLIIESDGSTGTFMLILCSLFTTGMLAMNHGQLILSWNSLHFDLLMSRGHTIHDIFKAKFYILILGCLLTYVLSLVYVLYSPKLVLYSTAMVFFNMTFSIFGYLFIASYNSLRIDPNSGGAFSFDGFGAAHYLIAIPLLLFPYGLFLIGNHFGGETGGLMLIGGLGLLGVIFHRQLLNGVVNNFKRNRYKISAAFRKKN